MHFNVLTHLNTPPAFSALFSPFPLLFSPSPLSLYIPPSPFSLPFSLLPPLPFSLPHSLLSPPLSPYCPWTHGYIQLGTALHAAVEGDHEDIVELLLEANIDPDLPEEVM